MIKSLYPLFWKWCEKGSIYIISDTHFEDSDCKIMDPFWLEPTLHIAVINRKLQKQDVLIHLGDVGNPAYIDAIKCNYKILITGNHDKLGELKIHFNEVFTGPLFISDRILLSHEPIFGLEGKCVNIHGHNHSGVSRTYSEDLNCYTHINLAANIVNYSVFNLGEEIKLGLLHDVKNYHRFTIDKASDDKRGKYE